MLEERVFKIIKDNLEIEIDRDLEPDDNIEDLKINSISFIRIIVGLEDEFNIEVDDDRLLYPAGEKLNHFIKMVEDMRAKGIDKR